jgi:YihY family inner membrane protein
MARRNSPPHAWETLIARARHAFVSLAETLDRFSAWRTLTTTLRIYSETDGEQRAASFAYYVFFSLFPMLALLLTVGSAFLNPMEIVEAIKGFLPLDAGQQEFLWKGVKNLEEARGSVGLISFVILTWSSLRFFQALVRGVNRAWHTVEIPWWQIPLKNLVMVGVIGSALFAGLLIPALLQGARLALVEAADFVHLQFPDFNLPLVSGLLDLSRYLIGAVVLFYSFSLLYMLAPRWRVGFGRVWHAALLVTVTLQFCQIAFVNYLPRVVNYGIYGAVGSLMLLLLWVYVSGIIIIFGGCLCAARAQVRGETVIPASSSH